MSAPRNAAQSGPEALGFSDLTEDERLVISISRDWRLLGPTRAVAEHRIARLLTRDRVYPALDALFLAFAPLFAEIDEPAAAELGDLLSRCEHELLDRLATGEAGDRELPSVCACREALERARIRLRPSGTIERSGRDALELELSRSYFAFVRMRC
ncbi:MAG: hypothetical protein AAF725_25875 [Acidobacteriota bacterium]